MVAPGGCRSQFPEKEREVVIAQTRPRELPARVDLLEGRPSYERTGGDDVDMGHVEPLEDRRIEVRGDEVRAEVFRQGQGTSSPASDRLEEIVQDCKLHDRSDLPSADKLPSRDEPFAARAK